MKIKKQMKFCINLKDMRKTNGQNLVTLGHLGCFVADVEGLFLDFL